MSPDLVKAADNWRPGIGLFAVHAALHKDITYRLGDGSEVYSTSGDSAARKAPCAKSKVAALESPSSTTPGCCLCRPP